MKSQDFFCREVKKAAKAKNDMMRGYYMGRLDALMANLPANDQARHDMQSAINEAWFLRYPTISGTRNHETA